MIQKATKDKSGELKIPKDRAGHLLPSALQPVPVSESVIARRKSRFVTLLPLSTSNGRLTPEEVALYDEGCAEYDVRMYKVLVWSRVDGGTGLLGWAYLRVLPREVGEAGVERMESAVLEVVVQVEETRKMSSILALGFVVFQWVVPLTSSCLSLSSCFIC